MSGALLLAEDAGLAAKIIDQVRDRQTKEQLDFDLQVQENTDWLQLIASDEIPDIDVRRSVIRQLCLREGVL